MDAIKTISDSLTLIGDLISSIEKAVAAGGGLVAEGEALLALVFTDANFKAAVSAVISDIKG